MFLLLSNQLLISQDLVSKEEAKTCPREAAPTTAYLSNAGTDSPIEHGIAHLYLPVIFCLQVRAEFWILSNCSIIPLFHFSIISTIPSFGKLSNALTASTGAPFALSFPKCLGFKMYFGSQRAGYFHLSLFEVTDMEIALSACSEATQRFAIARHVILTAKRRGTHPLSESDARM